MNLGLKREKFGDIFIQEETAQMIVAAEIADYVEWNVEKIGKASVKLEQIPFSELIIPKEQWTESMAIVSSMRLDNVLAQLYNQSRQRALTLIEKGLVKVNWKIIEQPHYPMKEGDYISVRGFGRAHIQSIEGVTRKDKIRILYRRLS